MRWARSIGCDVYDLWGAPDELVESDPIWGVYRFKQGFGASVVRHIGAYDYPISRLWYWIYMVAMPRLLALMRRRHKSAHLPSLALAGGARDLHSQCHPAY